MEGLKCVAAFVALLGLCFLLMHILDNKINWNGGKVRRKVFSNGYDLIRFLRKSEIGTDVLVYFSFISGKGVLLNELPNFSDRVVDLVVLSRSDLGIFEDICSYSELERAVHQLGYFACPPDIAAMVALKKPDCFKDQYIVFTKQLQLEKVGGFPKEPALFIIRKSIDFSVNIGSVTEPFTINENTRFVVMKRR